MTTYIHIAPYRGIIRPKEELWGSINLKDSTSHQYDLNPVLDFITGSTSNMQWTLRDKLRIYK